MFKAVSKYFRAVWYLLTFRAGKASESLQSNPGVVSAAYDQVIGEKRERLRQYKDAVSSMVAQEELKRGKLRELTGEIERLEKVRAGAASMAKGIVDKGVPDPSKDPDYIRHRSAYTDFSSTLREKRHRAAELDKDIKHLESGIAGHKVNLQSLMREIEKIKEEKHDTVAEIISASEEQQVADIISGISLSKASEELAELREIRAKASASARVSRSMASLDTARDEAEYRAHTLSRREMDEFDILVGAKTYDGEGEQEFDQMIPE